jgi:hypothetical protein
MQNGREVIRRLCRMGGRLLGDSVKIGKRLLRGLESCVERKGGCVEV